MIERRRWIMITMLGIVLAFALGMVIGNLWLRANPCLFVHPFTAEMMGCP